jgi:hypothetical protein
MLDGPTTVENGTRWSVTGIAARRARMYNRAIKSLASDMYKAIRSHVPVKESVAKQIMQKTFLEPYEITDVTQAPNGHISYTNKAAQVVKPMKTWPAHVDSKTKHFGYKELQ